MQVAARIGDVLIIRCRTCRRTREGLLHRGYRAEEIAAYSADSGRCYLLPVEILAGRSALQLRLGPSRNNQRLGINWADDFDFAARLRALVGP